MKITLGRTGNSYCTRFLPVLELTVASALPDKLPAVRAQHFEHLSDFPGEVNQTQ
jgi:hypothetical protein